MFIIEQNGHKLYVPGQVLLTSNLVGCANYGKITATSLEIMFFFSRESITKSLFHFGEWYCLDNGFPVLGNRSAF